MSNRSGGDRETLLGLLSGYWYSQGLAVLAELGIADLLSEGPASAADLAGPCGAHPETLFRFLRAMADAGLVAREGEDRFATTPLLTLLEEGHPGSLRALARFGGHPLHWQAWGNLLHAVRSGACAFEAAQGRPFFQALRESPEAARLFGQVMESSEALDEAILPHLDLPRDASILDIGGGSGSLLRKLVARRPDLAGSVFDLGPPPEEAGPIRFIQGDFLDSVPAGHDAYLLKFVLHNWDDARALRILKHCRAAMKPESRLYIVEVPLPAGPEPSHANRHDLNMLVLTGGRERTREAYEALLKEAGLRLSQRQEIGAGAAMLEADFLG